MKPDELDTKLREAINGAAELANACTHKSFVSPGPWYADHRAVFDRAGNRRIADTGGAIFAMHIAENGPPEILRRVAADRRVLDRHVQMSGGGCRYCCTSPLDDTWWPCPDLVDLADRYGIETEATDS